MDTSTLGRKHEFDLHYEQLEQMQRIEEPRVWVVKAVGSRLDHECILGDGMAKSLRSVGYIGVVTNGGLRDVAGFTNVPFYAFARGQVIHHSGLRIRSINHPVEVGGVVIRTGDVIHGKRRGGNQDSKDLSRAVTRAGGEDAGLCA